MWVLSLAQKVWYRSKTKKRNKRCVSEVSSKKEEKKQAKKTVWSDDHPLTGENVLTDAFCKI